MNRLNELQLRRLAPVFLLALGCALLIPTAACAATDGNAGNSSDEAPEAGSGTTNTSDLVAMLPESATTLGYVDFAMIRDSAAYQYLRNDDVLNDADFEDIIGETGIDPRTDLHRIAFVSEEGFGTWDDRGAFVVLATFDRDVIITSMGEVPTDDYSDRTLYQIGAIDRDDDDSDGEMDMVEFDADINGWMTFLTDEILAFGTDQSLRAIVDVADGAANARDNPALMGLLEDVDADAHLWLVSAQEGMFSGVTPGAGNPMGQIGYDRINAMIVALDLSDGLSLRMRGRTGAEEDAKNLGDALNGMVALGKMMLQSNSPEIFEILDNNIDTGSRGRDVTVNADLSIEDLEALRAYAESMIEFENSDEGVIG
ncbi:MAG: hypothetical protein GKS06_14355 [Acidobacteria bacterium]|nr:hypothetical protein [Acidobacteriota bacterium]